MICPYCNEEMESGVIHRDRYALKWIPEKNDKGALLSVFAKGIKLTNNDNSYVNACYCDKCKKVIIDVSS